MDEITKQIEAMAEKMEKSSTDPKESLFKAIQSLGAAGLKEKMATLSDDEKVVLKAALEEMTTLKKSGPETVGSALEKAVELDKEAQGAKVIQGKMTDTILQEEIASDDADEKLVKPAAAAMAHQGTPTDGWSGQVIKSIQDNEAALDQVIEKAMDKCGDDKMVMKKLKEKGMDEGKVQGALEKYKAKKQVKKSEPEVVATPAPAAEELEKGKMKDEAAKKIMAMEEKEHGTKDPKKLVEAEKKEHAMKKSCSWEGPERLLKANTQGRNHTFNLEQFVNETLKQEQPAEEVKKSEGQKEDVNDIIAKGGDTTWGAIAHAKAVSEAKTSGTLVKSFDDVKDLAASMGLSEEEAKKILGE